jgi:hypothetical protein
VPDLLAGVLNVVMPTLALVIRHSNSQSLKFGESSVKRVNSDESGKSSARSGA